MFLTERKLRKLIKKHLLEFGDPGFGDFMPTEDGTTMADDYNRYMMSPTGKALQQAQIEIIAGLTPAGIAVDVKDFVVAYNEGDGWGIVFSGIGFIPIGGDIAKNAHKLKKVQDAAKTAGDLNTPQLAKNIEKIKDPATGKIDAEDLDQVADIVSDSASSTVKVSRTVRGLDNIREALETLIKSDGRIYHIHTTRNANINTVKQKGVGLKGKTFEEDRINLSDKTRKEDWENREFNRTTYSNENIDYLHSSENFSALSIEDVKTAAFEGWPGTGGAKFTQRFDSNKNKLNSTFIIELPPGMKLSDVAEKVEGMKSARGQSRSQTDFIAVIPPKYIKGIIDRSGEEIVLDIIK